MEQLSGLDALFIHGEREKTPMHIASLMVYQPRRGAKKAKRFETVQDAFSRRLHKSPVFRRRLLEVPWQLENPWWVDDEAFALDNHLRRTELAPNSGRAGLNRLLGELQAQGLDMSRPLWEAWFIDGLDQIEGYPRNSYGLFIKAHHAALDGVSGAEIIAALNELSADAEQPEQQEWSPSEKAPPAWMLGWNAYFRSVGRPWKLAQSLGQLRPALKSMRQRAPKAETDRSHWLRTELGQQVGAERVIETLPLPLADLRAVRRLLPDTTMNHVILAGIGGALRRYLARREELPTSSLSAAIPVNVRRSDDAEAGNRVNIMISVLHTEIRDPLKRLEAVRDSALRARSDAQSMGADLVQRVTDMLSPRASRFSINLLHHASGIARKLPLPVQTIVSNIPGPPIALYQNGARLVDLQVFGLVVDGIGLFHAVVSYDDRMNLSVLGCDTTLRDPALYRRCLQSSFEELFALLPKAQPEQQATWADPATEAA